MFDGRSIGFSLTGVAAILLLAAVLCGIAIASSHC